MKKREERRLVLDYKSNSDHFSPSVVKKLLELLGQWCEIVSSIRKFYTFLKSYLKVFLTDFEPTKKFSI